MAIKYYYKKDLRKDDFDDEDIEESEEKYKGADQYESDIDIYYGHPLDISNLPPERRGQILRAQADAEQLKKQYLTSKLKKK